MGYAWEAAGGASDVWCDADPLLGRSLTSPMHWGARSLTLQVPSYASALDGRPDASKSVCKIDDSHAH
jgi:hypothetical protein